MARNEGISWGNAEENNDDDEEVEDYISISKPDKKPAPINLSALFKEQSDKASSAFAEIFNIEEKNKKNDEDGEDDKTKAKKKKSNFGVFKKEESGISSTELEAKIGISDKAEINQKEESKEGKDVEVNDDAPSLKAEEINPTPAESDEEIVMAAAEDITQQVEREATLEDARRRIEEVEQMIADRHLVKKDPEVSSPDSSEKYSDDQPEPTYGGAKFGASAFENRIDSQNAEDLEPGEAVTEEYKEEPESANSNPNDSKPTKSPPVIPPPFNPDLIKNNPADQTINNVNVYHNNQEKSSTYINNQENNVTEVKTTAGPALISFLAGEFFSRRRDKKLESKINKNQKESSKKIDDLDRRLGSSSRAQEGMLGHSTEALSVSQIIDKNRYAREELALNRKDSAENPGYRYRDGNIPTRKEDSILPDIELVKAESAVHETESKITSGDRLRSNDHGLQDKYHESIKSPKAQTVHSYQSNSQQSASNNTDHDQDFHSPNQPITSSNGNKPNQVNIKKQADSLTPKDYRDSVLAGSAIGAVMLTIFALVYYFVS